MANDIPAIFLRTPYNYDRNKASDEHGLKCKDPTLAQQQFAEECDINTIVDRFHLSGEMPQVLDLPVYGDFTGIFDYQSAMNQIVAARETFMSLPAKLRARFHNDPQEFVAFCSDDENTDEARKLGLLREKDATLAAPNAGTTTGGNNAPGSQSTTGSTPQNQAGSTGTTGGAPTGQTNN